MSILEGMVAGAGEALQNVGLQGVAAAIQAERDARLLEIRLSEEATIRQRGKDDAAAERTRVETEAADIASRRKVTPPDVEAQTDASAIALHSAQAAGTLPPGALETGLIGLSKYATDRAVPDARPTARDRMQAQGKHTEVANLQEKDVDNARADEARISNDEKWRATHEETARHNKVVESRAAEALQLKTDEREALSKAMDEYSSLIGFRAKISPNTDPRDVQKIDGDIARVAAKLQQYGIKVDASTGRASQIKVVKGEVGEGDSVIRDDGRGGVTRIDPKSLPIMGGISGAQEVRVAGKVIGHATTKQEADALVAKHLKSTNP